MKIQIKGNLTKNPIFRQNANGKDYALFTVAENHYKKNNEGQYEKLGCTFHKCISYGSPIEILKNMEKGQQVTLNGFAKELPAKGSMPPTQQIVALEITAGYKKGERSNKTENVA